MVIGLDAGTWSVAVHTYVAVELDVALDHRCSAVPSTKFGLQKTPLGAGRRTRPSR